MILIVLTVQRTVEQYVVLPVYNVKLRKSAFKDDD